MLGHTLADYELFIYALQDDFPTIQFSTLIVIRQASNVATVKGELRFCAGFRLTVREVVRFDHTPPQLSRYGYEVWRGDEKLYWYDPQAHPNDPALAATYPHHKHIPPDIRIAPSGQASSHPRARPLVFKTQLAVSDSRG